MLAGMEESMEGDAPDSVVAPRVDTAGNRRISRREFLESLANRGAGYALAWRTLSLLPSTIAMQSSPVPAPAGAAPSRAASWDRLPRWRGFNLLEKFTLGRNRPYQEW